MCRYARTPSVADAPVATPPPIDAIPPRGAPQTVFLVDHDEGVRDALEATLVSAGYEVVAFSGGQEFLDEGYDEPDGCLVLDFVMPGLAGVALVATVRARFPDLPVVVVTGHGDVDHAVGAMKAGALDFVMKPVFGDRLLEAVAACFRHRAKSVARRTSHAESRVRLRRLSAREHQVVDLVVSGMQTRDIATSLGISPYTVEHHRSRLMAKMGAPTLADLVRRVCEAVL